MTQLLSCHTIIEFADSTKYLGIYIDSHLSDDQAVPALGLLTPNEKNNNPKEQPQKTKQCQYWSVA